MPAPMCKCLGDWFWGVRFNHSYFTFSEVTTRSSITPTNNLANGMAEQSVLHFNVTNKTMRLTLTPLGGNSWRLTADWDGEGIRTHDFNHDFSSDPAGPQFELSWDAAECPHKDFWFEVFGGPLADTDPTLTLPCDYHYHYDGLPDNLTALAQWWPKSEVGGGGTRRQGDPFLVSPRGETFNLARNSAADDSLHTWRGSGSVGEVQIGLSNGCGFVPVSGAHGSKWYYGGPYETHNSHNAAETTTYPFRRVIPTRSGLLITLPVNLDGTEPGRISYHVYSTDKVYNEPLYGGTVSVDGQSLEGFSKVLKGTSSHWFAYHDQWGETMFPLTKFLAWAQSIDPAATIDAHSATLSITGTNALLSIRATAINFTGAPREAQASANFDISGGSLSQTSTVDITYQGTPIGTTIDLGINLTNDTINSCALA